MKNIIDFIIESSEFNNTNMTKEILDDKQIKYNLDKGTNSDYLRIKNSNTNITIAIKKKNAKHVSGEIYASSRTDDADIVLQILDNFNNYPSNKKLFDELKKQDYKETNNYKNAQWGTWKFVISSWDELEEIADIMSEL